MAKKSGNDTDDVEPQDDNQRGRVKSDFPKHALESTLRVARAIEETNGGRPIPPTELAIGMGISPGSSDFRMMLSSSLKYGLTTGSYKNDRVSLTTLGTTVVSPKDEADYHGALVSAALNPPTFKAMYAYFRGKKLPEPLFFQNTVVRDFDVPREHAVKCVDVFCANVEFVQLIRVAPTGKWLSTEQIPQSPSIAEVIDEEDDEVPNQSETQSGRQVDGSSSTGRIQLPSANTQSQTVPKAIFIGHGKNKRPLEQLKQIMDHYHIPYRVVVEEANSFRPISEKVGDAMRQCGAAILIFTADEEFKDLRGETVFRPSENVIHELGAASILYGGRIIVFKEEAVKLPTNFSGIGYISFAKDDLSAKMHDLFRELVAFSLIKISVGV